MTPIKTCSHTLYEQHKLLTVINLALSRTQLTTFSIYLVFIALREVAPAARTHFRSLSRLNRSSTNDSQLNNRMQTRTHTHAHEHRQTRLREHSLSHGCEPRCLSCLLFVFLFCTPPTASHANNRYFKRHLRRRQPATATGTASASATANATGSGLLSRLKTNCAADASALLEMPKSA